MYIWVAINVNEQVKELREKAENYVKELREKAENYVKEQGLSSTTFTLPFHISLKISFQVPDDKFEEAVNDIRDFYKSLKPFQTMVRGIEQEGPIVWITLQNSNELADIHKALDEMLFEKYGVIQHDFDKDFRFHTSVLMIDNEEQITKAFGVIKNTDIPEILRADRFIIGSSVEGKAGTYGVIEEIEI